MPKRILFLEHNVDGTVGGSHVCLLGICKYLDRREWLPVVVFYQDNALISAFRDLGLEVHILKPFEPWVLGHRGQKVRNRVSRTAQSILNFLRMVLIRPWFWTRWLRSMRIDAVHLNNSCGEDIDLILSAKVLRIPVIAHQRGFPPRFGRLERVVARRLNRIIAVSDVVRAHLIERNISPTKVLTIHDGIELDRLEQRRAPEELRLEFQLGSDELVVGMLGNVKQWKGQEVLVDAMDFIVRRYPGTRFMFVGQIADERYKAKLDEKITALGLEGRAIFTGYRRDATDVIAVMDVVVHASIEPEPFGLVVLEAMGKGKPIVAANIGGPRETVIDGVTGQLFISGCSQSLSNVVCDYLGDSSSREKTGEAGATHVREKFSIQRNVGDVEMVYRNLLGP